MRYLPHSLKTGLTGLEFSGLVHDSARADAVLAGRHRTFIAAHATAGFAALCVLPVYLAVYGQPRVLEAAAFALLSAPVAIAFFLSLTGRYRAAHILSAANLSALAALAGFAVAGAAGVLPSDPVLAQASGWLMTAAAAILIAVGALLGASLADTGGGALAAIHPATGNAGDGALPVLISVHRPNGKTISVRGGLGATALADAGKLHDDGFFAHVHVADRPAFLSAIRRAAHGAGAVGAYMRLAPGALAGPQHEAGAGDGFAEVEMMCRPLPDEGSGEQGRNVVCVTRSLGEAAMAVRYGAAMPDQRDNARSGGDRPGAFLKGMDHELRTPLNAIIGFADLMHRQDDLSRDKIRDYSALVRESGHALLRAVNDLLTLANGLDVTGQRGETYTLNALVQGCIEETADAFESAGVTLDHDGLGDVPGLAADRKGCAIVLRHALLAMLYQCRDGAVLRMSARRHGAMARVELMAGAGASQGRMPGEYAGVPGFDQAGSSAGEGASSFSLPIAEAVAAVINTRLGFRRTPGGALVMTIDIPCAGAAGEELQERALREGLRKSA